MEHYAVVLEILFLLILFLVLWRNKSQLLKDYRNYFKFLLEIKRFLSFLLATLILILCGLFANDPTWDIPISTIMAVLTYFTAPWTIGVIYKSIKREKKLYELYSAICFWLFSASWSYDLWDYLKTGSYPTSWTSNLALSSVLYFSAGFFWSLSWNHQRGVCFIFTDPSWPDRKSEFHLKKIALWALPFILLFSGVVIGLVIFQK